VVGWRSRDTLRDTASMLKRVMDIGLSSLALLFLLPLFAAIAVAIKLDSPGPVFFRQERIGRFGKPFRIFKFRTMIVNADKAGPSSTASDDPRITRMGKFIRRFNIDELPQFINVLKGDMSIVGPRPQVPWAVDLYTEEERVILSVRPGITDWATIWIRDEGEILRGSTDPDKDYLEKIWPEKRRLQLEYVRNHSILTDMTIMVRTFQTHLLDRILKKGTGQ